MLGLIVALVATMADSLGPSAPAVRQRLDVLRRAIDAGSVAELTTAARARLDARAPVERRLARLEYGLLLRLQYDYAGADSILAGIRDGAGDAVAIAATMEQAALAQRNGDVSRARRLLEEAASAAAASGDAPTVAEAELVLSGLDLRAGAGSEAWRRLAVADSVARDGPASVRALVHCQRASLLGFGARMDASAEARRGIALAQAAGQRRIEAQCLLSMGAGFAQRGLADSAMPSLNAAIERSREVGDHPVLAAALQWRGFLHRSLGRVGDAHADLRNAVEAAERSDTRGPLAWAWLNLAIISLALRDAVDAHERLVAAQAEFERQGDRWGLETARQVHGAVLWQLGEMTAAESLTVASLHWARASQAAYAEGVALVQLITLARARRALRLADARLDTLAMLVARHDLRGWAGTVAYQRALQDFATGRLVQAEHRLRAYLPLLEQRQATQRFATHARLAEVLVQRGRVSEAADELTLAMDQLDRARGSLTDAAYRQLVFQASGDPAVLSLGTAGVIAAVAESGAGARAFTLADRRRARELADRRVLMASVARGDRAPFTRNPVEPASLDAFQALLREQEAAGLLFVIGRAEEPAVMLVVTPTSVRGLSLPRVDSLTRLIRRAADAVAEGRAPQAALRRQLADLLLAPASELQSPRIRRLIIVPEGPLYMVPFAALPTGDGRAAAQRWALSISPSAALALEQARSRVAPRPASRMLALGDPALAAPRDVGASRALYDVFAAAGATGALPGARQEVRRVSRYATRRDVRIGRHASEQALMAEGLADVAVLHLASHAVVDDRSPLRTAIALSPSAAGDGFLTAPEVAALRLPADLVVLSGCRTARGRVIGGEGLQGLATPFLAAGARAVIASLWEVRDDAVAPLMDDLYRAMADGAVAADALAEAQRRAIARGDPVTTWAAFTLIGDPIVRPPLRPPPRGPIAALAGSLLALAVLASVSRRGRGTSRATGTRVTASKA